MRINPTIPIPALVTAVHGISDADVKDCPTFADVARELFDFMNHADIAGYNSNYFDVPLITEEFSRCNLDFASVKRHFIDAFRIFQKMEKRDLSSAYRYYCGKTLENAHQHGHFHARRSIYCPPRTCRLTHDRNPTHQHPGTYPCAHHPGR